MQQGSVDYIGSLLLFVFVFPSFDATVCCVHQKETVEAALGERLSQWEQRYRDEMSNLTSTFRKEDLDRRDQDRARDERLKELEQKLHNHDVRHAATLDSILSLKTSQSTEVFKVSQVADNLTVDLKMMQQRYVKMMQLLFRSCSLVFVSMLCGFCRYDALKRQVASNVAKQVNMDEESAEAASASTSSHSDAELDLKIERRVAAAIATALKTEQLKRETMDHHQQEAFAAEV